MRKLRTFLCLAALSCVSIVGHAANMSLYLVDEEDFYQANPSQISLTQQFSVTVNAVPLPIRMNQEEPIRVAMLLFGVQTSTENQALLLSFKRRMRELGIDYRLDTYLDNSVRGDDLTPYFKMMGTQPDYIVMTKFGFVQRRFLERFLVSGKSKVILYDFASPLRYWKNHPPLIYIGVDQKQATKHLANYLDVHLPDKVRISAITLTENYIGKVRCNLFLDEMFQRGRNVRAIKVIDDNKNAAFQSAQALLEEGETDFIFSCSKIISEGVIAALEENQQHFVQTNTWEPVVNSVTDFKRKSVKASVFFERDNLAIGVAEAIKLDLEGRNMPTLYMAGFQIVGAETVPSKVRLMIERIYPYSVALWQQ